jgi:hypothetical protein
MYLKTMIMKKVSFCILFSVSIAVASYSQSTRLNLYGNYVFDDKIDSYYSNTNYYNGKIKGGFLWGGGIEHKLHEYYGIELLYLRLDSKATMEYYDIGLNNVKQKNIDLGINYILVGGTRSATAHGSKTEAYGGFLLGMAIIDTKDPEKDVSSSATKFAWGARLGANIWASEKVGVKIQALLLSVPQGAGGGLYFGTSGSGAAVSTYSTMLQFAIGGGLTFKLG